MILPIILIIVAIANFLVGAMVIARRYRHPLHQCFLLLTVGVGLWSLTIGFYYITPNLDHALFYVNAYYAAALLIASSLFAFVYSLKLRSGALPWPAFAMQLVPFAYVIMSIIFPHMLLSIQHTPYDVTLHRPVYILYSLTFTAIFGSAALKLINYVRRAHGRSRRQLSVVATGVTMAGVVGVLCNLVLPYAGRYEYIWIGPAFSVVFLVSTSYAVVRYRLFDLRMALARALAYLISLFWVIIIYALALFLVGLTLFGQTHTSTLQNLVYLGLAVLLTFTFQPLKQFFDRYTRHLFFKQTVDPERTIEKFGDVILSDVELSQLTKKVFSLIDDTFAPETAVLCLRETPDERYRIITHPPRVAASKVIEPIITQLDELKTFSLIDVDDPMGSQEIRATAKMEDAGIGIVLRLRTTKRQLGYLFMGQRRNGGSYSSADRYILTTLADELALAIENSLQFQQIKEFNATLQARVDEATAKLKTTNKKLHEIDESKDEFISMASHQLRTPLTTVKGYISMLLDGDVGELTSQQRKVLEEAFSSSQRMVFLIGDFLNVSRLQTGKFELELHTIDLAKVLKQEVSQMQDSARSRKMILEYEPPFDIPPLLLDENKIRQVIMNFIDNAIYYSHPGDSIQVTLSKSNDYVSVRVSDHGIGVPAHERHKLFAKFYRASNAKKQRPDGTGIGLFMARKVIVAHGGSIIFETTEGKGSTFGFRLPLGSGK